MATVKLPAVSGSSGHLVVERSKEADEESEYPGKVFANAELDYAEAMKVFVESSQPVSGPRKKVDSTKNTSKQAKIRQLRQKEAELSAKRRNIRKLRDLENQAWKTSKQQRAEKSVEGQPKLRADRGSCKRKKEEQKRLREARQQQINLRQQEDQQWRLDRLALREELTLLPVVTSWIAVLLVTDNCSRQCLGLPIFVAGSHVTAELVVDALRVLLPTDLQFLISDRGVHFTAQVFQQLSAQSGFVHVLIARHRPQSNGIAERFVRTIKESLADKTWSSDQELQELLRLFLLDYNNRPHQGLPIPGLSPNEFANRVWVM